jgi:antitoxin component YwqK of YwqJK toxin-antitoxin module
MRLLYVLMSFGLLISSTCALAQRNNINGLSINDNKYFQNGSPYSGEAYNCYQSGQLKEEFSLMNGMFNGIYATYKIDDRYDKSKYIDTILIAKKIILIEEVKLDILKLKKDSIRSLDSIWMQEEELLGGKVFKQLESIEVLKRKEKLKSIEDKYTYDKLNKKKVDLYDKYADARKKFQDCTESLATYRFRLKAHNEWLVNEKNKPIYKNILGETFNYERGVQTGTHVVYTKSGDREIEETLDNGKKNGPYKRYSGNKIVEEGNYVNNEKEGEWTTLNSSEKITQNFSKGKLNGASKKYNNDVLVETGQFMNGLMTGVWKFYYLNGKIKGEGSFTNGDGGDLGSTGIPKNGRDGKWVLYYENGNKEQEFNYQSGLIEGVVIRYHDNGNVSTRCNYINGKPEGECFHFYNGGQKQYNILYLNGAKEGVFTEYFENGKIKRTGQHKNNKFHGSFKNYSDNGNLILEYEMKEGVSEFEGNIQIEYNENGEFSRKFKYNNGNWERSLTPEEADKKLKELHDKNNEIVSCNWCGREFKYGKGYDFAHYKYTNHTCDCSLIGIGGYFCSPKCSIEWCEK